MERSSQLKIAVVLTKILSKYMWLVDMEHYSVVYLIALLRSKRCECMSFTLNESSVPQRFEGTNAIKLRNGIMFNFYPGLPHI